MDGQNAETRGQVLFYPNPFRIRDGAILQYYLNKPETVRIEIYNIFGKMLFRTIHPSGSDGGRNNVNKLEFNASVFRYFDAPAGFIFCTLLIKKIKLWGNPSLVLFLKLNGGMGTQNPLSYALLNFVAHIET